MNVWLCRLSFFITGLLILSPHVLRSATLQEYLELNNKLQQALVQKNVPEAQKHINQIYQWLRADQNKPVLQQLRNVFNKDANSFFNEQLRKLPPPPPPVMSVPRPPTTPPPGSRPTSPLKRAVVEKPSISADEAAELYRIFINDFEKLYEAAETAKNYKQYKDATQKIEEAAKLLKYLERRFALDESNVPFLQEIEKKLALVYSKVPPPRGSYNLTQSLRQKRVKFNKLLNRFLHEQIDLIEKIIKEQIMESDLKKAQQKSSLAIQMDDDRKKLAEAVTKIKTEQEGLYAKLPAPQLLKANKVLARVMPAS
jgi:hypothetical protein